MLKKVIVNGANGKMGSLAAETIKNNPDFELVATLSRNDNLIQSISETNADIVIDLTNAESVYQNTLAIIEANAHPVIGTSGLLQDEIANLKILCDEKKLGCLIVPNFSLSAILMMKFAKLAALHLQEVEIIEAHHQNKLDAPSSTALKTAELINEGKNKNKNQLNLKELIPGARGGEYNKVNIHSIRLPGILARQEVIFGNTGETLSIVHNTIDRSSFMPGVLLACHKVFSLNTLYYGLESILEL